MLRFIVITFRKRRKKPLLQFLNSVLGSVECLTGANKIQDSMQRNQDRNHTLYMDTKKFQLT
uniref:Uncharacterized protein n=1 Tax=Arundo donax TaxID=35708 RepID=A0A0A9EHS8_ARUDO